MVNGEDDKISKHNMVFGLKAIYKTNGTCGTGFHQVVVTDVGIW